MICPSCKKEIPDNSIFCPHCAYKVADSAPSSRRRAENSARNVSNYQSSYRKQSMNSSSMSSSSMNSQRTSYYNGSTSSKKQSASVGNIVFLGVSIVAGIVIVASLCTIFLLKKSSTTNGNESNDVEQVVMLEEDVVEVEATPEPTIPSEPTVAPEPTATPTPEPTPTPEAITFTLRRESEVDLSSYTKTGILNAMASSTIDPSLNGGKNNSVHMLFDEDDSTTWQEGRNAPGDPGIGEYITVDFDKTYKVKYIKLKLGNWNPKPRNGRPSYYWVNSRPKTLRIELGESTTVDGMVQMGASEICQMTFPDEQSVFFIELNAEYPASTLKLTIDDVYYGNNPNDLSDHYEDTCMTEVAVYGIPN